MPHANPDRVDRLILISPGGFSINGVTEKPVPVPAMVQFYLTSAPEATVRQALKALYADPGQADRRAHDRLSRHDDYAR